MCKEDHSTALLGLAWGEWCFFGVGPPGRCKQQNKAPAPAPTKAIDFARGTCTISTSFSLSTLCFGRKDGGRVWHCNRERAHEPQRSKAGNHTHMASLAAGAENAIFDMAPGTWQYSQHERHELHANARLDQSGSRLLTAECDKTVKIYREEILTALPPPLCFALLRSASLCFALLVLRGVGSGYLRTPMQPQRRTLSTGRQG